ncbi:MAG TPA: Flp pilus assembly complex ATPase component TadA [Pseudomonadaceae bacterium]|nr:Flp pilus assembly complex ATPase component TadA [Pseudomonadaceae bacterium]
MQTQGALDLRLFLARLCADGHIDRSLLESLLERGRGAQLGNVPLLAFIADQSIRDQANPGQLLDIEWLTRKLADYAGQPYYRIDPLNMDAVSITAVMSLAFAQRHRILAVEVRPHEVLVASMEPFLNEWQADLEHLLRKPVKRVVANPVEIQRLTKELYRLASSISFATSKGGNKGNGLGNLEQMLDIGKLKDPEASDQHVVSIVDWLLQYAFEQRASDIHIEPRRDIGNLRFRIDGVLYTVYQMPMQVLAAVTSRIKALGRMNVAEKRRPQDGRLKTRTPEGSEVELRLSTLPTAFGEKLVLRIFDPDVLLKSFTELGFSATDQERWESMIRRKHGIILITGPTGSGKTTTLYSTLKLLATREVNVCTIEDPIEMVESSFNQMQVQENIDLDFASGVKALLRQDPDIIMIGEIRDLETADIAIQAALTGHLVFSSLHTNDAPSAITRMLELGVPSYLLKATLIGVVAQRLVRVLCPHCKQGVEPDAALWHAIADRSSLPLPPQVYEPVGCLSCRETGYKGRSGVYEIMPFNDSLHPFADDAASLPQLRRNASLGGMTSLRHSGALKAAAGLSSVLEVLRVTPETD